MLIAGALLIFSIIAWQVLVWAVVMPTAALTAQILTQRAQAALTARSGGLALPDDAHFVAVDPAVPSRHFGGFAYGAYVEAVRRDLQAALGSPDVRINRLAAPSEIWVKMPQAPGQWLVLSWRLAGPKAPLAGLVVLAAGALVVLGGAATSARRLTAPLAGLAAAAARVAEGDKVDIATDVGPCEVRSLAVAFQSMSHRLGELDGQREVMLGGISHDLRTPLARLRVAVELLESRDAALIGEMTASIGEMDDLIGRFLHYVRANYRELPGPASLDGVVRQALAAYARDGNLHVDLHAAEERAFAVDCVRHTVVNLVGNALEYGQGAVTVRTALSEHDVLIQVSDHGRGLTPAEWLDAIKPFHRLRSQPSQGHSGLGLALVDRLVRTCGGTLQCGRSGGRFVITARLPACRVAAGTAVRQS
jgi:two-component system osmolarity sensor histidine kinase EnvZ